MDWLNIVWYLFDAPFVLIAVVARMPITSWSIRAIATLLLTALLIATLQKVLPQKPHKYIGI